MSVRLAPAPTGASSTPGFWRRNRAWWLIAAVVLIVVGVLAFASGGDQPSDVALDPGNPGPDGTKALAQVLEDHGVDVSVAHGEKSFLGKRVDADTTVVVTSTYALSDKTTDNLLDHVADAGSLVTVRPRFDSLAALHTRVSLSFVNDAGKASARCNGLPEGLLDGLSIDVADSDFYRNAGQGAGTGCFPDKENSGYRVWRVPGATGSAAPENYLLGAERVLTNHGILDGDNAAIALRLLGQHDRVVWYVADAADVPIGDTGSVASHLPRWLTPGLWLIAITMLVVMYWRGRRLGRVVFEPLPVVIRSVESTLSRGRLYRKVRDRPHAAAVLRRATRARLLSTLRLPADLSAPQLVDAVSRRTARDAEQVRRLLTDAPVADDRTLTDLARALADLEKEVRQP